MQRLELLRTGLRENADQVHDRVGIGDRAGDVILVADIRPQQLDLPHMPHRQQEIGEIGPPHAHAHTVAEAALGECADRMTP